MLIICVISPSSSVFIYSYTSTIYIKLKRSIFIVVQCVHYQRLFSKLCAPNAKFVPQFIIADKITT